MVKVSKVAEMLHGNAVARSEVDEAVLCRKAKDWEYEKEWRMIGHRGLHSSPLELKEIIFGIRCPAPAKYVTIKALEDRDQPVKFFEMREVPGHFTLKKCALSTDDELFTHFPRRWLTTLEAFKNA